MPDASSTPQSARSDRWFRWLALVVLLAGLVGIAVRHLPVTTWAVPVSAGPVAEWFVVWGGGCIPRGVRLDVGPEDRDAGARTLRLVAPGPWTGRTLGRTGRVQVELEPGDGPVPPDPVVATILADLQAWEGSWPPRPAFLSAPGGRHLLTPMQRAEAVVLDGVLLAWLTGLLASLGALGRALGGVRGTSWATLAGLVLAQGAFVRLLGIGGIWHANNHGYERVADVVLGVAPAAASLGLLHGYGYYTVFQPLHALTGLGVFDVAQLLSAGALVGLFVWLRGVMASDRAALLGVAWLACVPIFLRLSMSESMYVPALWWLTVTLAAFELYLRTDGPRWWGLGLASAFLLMQTRAEMMVLVPVWLGITMLVRRPDWLGTAWRRPSVWAGLGVAGLAFVPRLAALVATPIPTELRRVGSDPLGDARLGLLVLVGVACVVGAPGPLGRALARRVSAPVGWGALALGLLGLAVLDQLRPFPGPAERLVDVHPLLAGPASSWALAGLVVTAAWVPVRRQVVVVAGLAWVVATWIYLPQWDCLSTYVRTGMATLPWLALAASVSLERAWQVLGARKAWPLVGLVLAGSVGLSVPWLTFRYPKQVRQDVFTSFLDQIGPRDAVVALLPSDVPAAVQQAGFRVTANRVDRELPATVRVVGIADWQAGAVADADRVWFFRDLACQRAWLSPDGRAWTGHDATTWTYADVARISTAPRVVWGSAPGDWMQPLCREAVGRAVEERLSAPVPGVQAGTIHETPFGTGGRVGWYRLPNR